MPMRVTSRPLSAGTSAATGLPKISSSITKRIGSASSSPLCSESIDDSFSARTSGASPVICAVSGGRTARRIAASTSGTVSSEMRSNGRRTCSASSAWPRGSLSTRSPPIAHGLRTSTPSISWSSRTSRGPRCSTSFGGPSSSTAMLIVPPNSRFVRSDARAESLPGMRRLGWPM